MSPYQNPLQTNDLSATVALMESLSQRVRQRIREEMTKQRLSQRDVSGLLKWSQSRVAKLLTGRVELGVDDLGALAFAVGISPTEAVRDRGLEFCAELTPTELRMLEHLRLLPPEQRDAFFSILRAQPSHLPDRHARPMKKMMAKRGA
jgi:transcriptional regulator with XRE-family HTH domain